MIKARKIALITGGAKRIGKSITTYLANNGWDVVVQYNNSEKEANILQQELSKIANIYVYQCDFSIPENIPKFFKQINYDLGDINLLVNNASSFVNDNSQDFNLESFRNNIDINLLAPAILIKEFSKQSIFAGDASGNIINILDYCIFSPPTNFYSYTISKMGLKYLIDINANLLAPKIRINGISLGAALKNTRQNLQNFKKSYSNSMLEIPTSLEDINSTLEFILTTKSLTGEVISIDSGKRFSSGLYI